MPGFIPLKGNRENKRTVLVEALIAKIIVLLDTEEASDNQKQIMQHLKDTKTDKIDELLDELSRWVDMTDVEFAILNSKLAARHGRWVPIGNCDVTNGKFSYCINLLIQTIYMDYLLSK